MAKDKGKQLSYALGISGGLLIGVLFLSGLTGEFLFLEKSVPKVGFVVLPFFGLAGCLAVFLFRHLRWTNSFNSNSIPSEYTSRETADVGPMDIGDGSDPAHSVYARDRFDASYRHDHGTNHE